MGWIVLTSAGTHRVNWRDAAGRQRAKTFDLKREAKAFLAQVEADAARGTYVDPHAGRKVRLRDFAAEWLAGRNVETTTGQRTLSLLRTHVLPRWGDWPISAVEHSAVQRWARDLSQQRAPATVAKCVGTLSMILDAAVRERLIAANPCDGVRLAGQHRSSVEMLTVTQKELTQRLLPATTEQHRPMVAVAALAGLRWGECAGLPWHAVDLAGAELRVRQVAVETTGRVEVRAYPKSRAAIRTVPMPAALVKLVGEHRERTGLRHPLVFPTRTGSPVRRSNFRRQVWVPALAKAGLPARLRFHDLRHSYATWLISSGVPVNVVQRLMGHEQASTTLNRYVHAPRDYDERVRQVLNGSVADFLLTAEGA